MMWTLLFLSCDPTSGRELASMAGSRERIDDDGFPVYDCPAPPDDTYILSMPNSYALMYMNETAFTLYVNSGAVSWIEPLDGVRSVGFRWREDGSYFEYEMNLWGTIWANGLDHPTDAQGEQTTTIDTLTGVSPRFEMKMNLTWDGQWSGGNINWVDYYNPATLCISRIRHQRVQGSYTFYPLPDHLSDWIQFPVSILFDLQESTPSEGSLTGTYVYQHQYTENEDPFLAIRNLGTLYHSYDTGVTAEEVWDPSLFEDDSG